MMKAPTSDHNGVVALFTRHPNAANLLMVLMILLGLYGLSRINTQTWPSVDADSIRINISWPGASAQDVESNILLVVEPAVRFVDGVNEMTSVAREGSGRITLEFERGSDMPRALSDVEAIVAGLTTLPVDIETPRVSLLKWYEGVARLAVLGPYSEQTMKATAKRIRDDLVNRGIDRVTFTGLRDEEVAVTVKERDFRRLGLTIGDVSSAIADNSRDLPSGSLDGQISRQIRALAESRDPLDLRRVEVKTFA
ncbi:MAG: efflux RND transporter permease subunit, partial [Pseudomonadota bacterium]